MMFTLSQLIAELEAERSKNARLEAQLEDLAHLHNRLAAKHSALLRQLSEVGRVTQFTFHA